MPSLRLFSEVAVGMMGKDHNIPSGETLEAARVEFFVRVDEARSKVEHRLFLSSKYLRPTAELWEHYLRDLKFFEPVAGGGVLDLGAGPGYLLWFCRQLYACRIYGLEPKLREDYRAIWDALGIREAMVEQRISAFKPIEVPGTFDCIAAVAICFNVTGGVSWGPGEYEFFLSDAVSHLNGSGHLYLRFNRALSKECRSVFDTRGHWLSEKRFLTWVGWPRQRPTSLDRVVANNQNGSRPFAAGPR